MRERSGIGKFSHLLSAALALLGAGADVKRRVGRKEPGVRERWRRKLLVSEANVSFRTQK